MKLCVVLVAILLGSCEMGGESVPFNPTGAQNALGQLCTTPQNCPTNHDCVFLSAGNPAQGYCSPLCATATDCATGYTGPASGQLNCVVPNNPDACSIACQTDLDCPSTLACKSPMGGMGGAPFKFCATR